MNKYIITHECLETSKGEQEFIISALYNEKRQMIEVNLSPQNQESLLGNIYIGRVENIVKNLNAAFIKIDADHVCYYSLDDYKNPLFTKKLSEKKLLVAGDEVVVQVEKEALKTKAPAVTTNLSFTGKYVVLTTGNHHLGISTKLSKPQRAHYQELLKEFDLSDYGLIVRTNAVEATDQELLAEIRQLEAEWRELSNVAVHKTCYSCLKKTPENYLTELNHLPKDSIEEILTDDRSIFESLCALYHIPAETLMTSGSVSVPVDEVQVNLTLRLRYYHDDMLTLSSLYSVKSSLQNALKEQVWLKSGAYLVIQPTEALTVIDVNSGKNISKKGTQENFLKINIEAAKEIAKQLRLRNISGIIVVDFINLQEKEAEAELLKEFRAALKNDPVKTDLIDITKLGLVEVTRKKVKKSLLEILS